ncbi:MAG: hypothetical protein J0H55_15995 [Chitinophagaceae bacterium]|nr:hypothetical protein [Chitinophagaceae bacterium]
MKNHILRLESSINSGISGHGSGLIEIIYSFLLPEYKINFFDTIHVNEIGYDLKESVLKVGRNVYINLWWPMSVNFESVKEEEKKFIRLRLVHRALMMLADEDERINKDALEEIRKRILKNNFSFEFVMEELPNELLPDIEAKLVVVPENSLFNIFLYVYKMKERTCRLLIYQGIPVPIYLNDLFSSAGWKDAHHLIISGSNSEVTIKVDFENCKIEYQVQGSTMLKAPYFELFKSYKYSGEPLDVFVHSLNPGRKVVVNHDI